MTGEFGSEIGPSEVYEDRLEELLDRLEFEESGRPGWVIPAFEAPASGLAFDVAPTTSRPIFDVTCGDCPVAACRPVLLEAIIEAIKLANNAARKLEAAVKVAPASRGKEAQETARLFRAFFCHDLSTPIPWAGNEASGVSIAKRFRAVARELGGGRRITFLCLPTKDPCPDDDLTCCNQTSNAWSLPGDNRLRLCATFWNPGKPLRGLSLADYRAAIIIHEMLHILFGAGPEGRRGGLHDSGKRANAHCYEAFVLRVNSFGADPADVRQCGLC